LTDLPCTVSHCERANYRGPKSSSLTSGSTVKAMIVYTVCEAQIQRSGKAHVFRSQDALQLDTPHALSYTIAPGVRCSGR